MPLAMHLLMTASSCIADSIQHHSLLECLSGSSEKQSDQHHQLLLTAAD
jgi:hypothetical protein